MTNTVIFWAVCFIGGFIGAAFRGAAKDPKTRALQFFIPTAAAFACAFICGALDGAARTVFIYIAGCAAMFACGVLVSALTALFAKGAKKRAKKRAASQKEYKTLARGIAARSLAALTVCVLVLSLGAAFVAGVDTSEAFSSALRSPASARARAVNILVCGVDYVSTDAAHQQAMSDVIMIANVDKTADKAALLQIPRDTYVGTELTATGKINAVFNTESASGRGGVHALAEVLNDQLQLPLDHYICITMEGFRAAVDLVGGVDITLAKAMTFNLRDENEVIVRTVTLGPGTVTLDGEMADLFVRYRDYARADLDRMDVQRYFIAALLNKLSATSAPKLLGLARKIYPYIDTDLSIAQMMSLALTLKGFSADAITALRAPGEPVNDYHGQSVFSLHKTELAEMLNEYMRPYGEDVAEEALGALEIQNTTSVLDGDGGPMSEYGA